MKIEKAKSGYPSMLDSGVYGLIVPKSLVGNDKVQNTQLVSDNDSISQNENLEEDNNFDTMINPKIGKIKASPDKREAK